MKFREQFQLFDADGSGAIDEEELRTVLSQLGKSLSDAELRAMIAEVRILIYTIRILL
jgi:Ca2+-binding EF-hand superfamily protein